MGGYAGLQRSILYLHGRTIVDAQPPRMLQDSCDGLVPFPELNGRRDRKAQKFEPRCGRDHGLSFESSPDAHQKRRHVSRRSRLPRYAGQGPHSDPGSLDSRLRIRLESRRTEFRRDIPFLPRVSVVPSLARFGDGSPRRNFPPKLFSGDRGNGPA